MKRRLQDRWIALCGKFERDGIDSWHSIYTAYASTDRAYHNIDHIADCLVRFDEHADLSKDGVALELAIWFHDLVYDTKAPDNEERSAEAAEDFLRGTPIAEDVANLIRATKHDSAPCSMDAKILCDIDLSILGAEASRYAAYAKAIREEYAWVSMDDYTAARTQVLSRFLSRPQIYVLPEFRDLYERQARLNLQSEIESLT